MNYEKLHKDTINKLQQMVNSGKITVETACGICADFVPENEDEVMIKFIKNQLFNIKKTITENYELDAKLTKAIDWLEKQGTPYTKRDVDDAYLEGVRDTKNEIEKQYEANYQIRKDIATFIFNYRGVIKDRAKWIDYLGIKVSFVEKQDEQKPAGEYNITGIGSKHAQGKLGEMIKRKLEMEKQGEHTKFYDSIQVGDKVTRNQDGVLVNLSQLKRVAKKDETQCEQKPQGKLALKAVKQETIDNINKSEPKDYSSIDPHYFKPTDNVEPKFHEGDWIVHHGTENIYQVVAHIDNQYQLKYGDNYTIQNCVDVDRCSRLYDVAKDAKDGDVLFTTSTASHETFIFKSIDEKGNAKCYFAYDSEDGFREGKYHFIGSATDCKPATKEQRDLLFQKMKEAGYEWDAEKKELKKISQEYPLTPDECIKPAWSEEDEKMLNDILMCGEHHCYLDAGNITWLKSIKDKVQPQQKQEWSEEDKKIGKELIDFCVKYGQGQTVVNSQNDFTRWTDWLKSLRPQNTWKPSDEQIIELRHVISGCSYDIEPLVELETKLKEL